MSRKSLILCLSILAALIVGTGIAVAFLYKGVEPDNGKKTSKVVSQDRYRLLAAVPSDAVLVACFSDKGPQERPMVVSMHYSGKLLPLYVYDAGLPGETGDLSDEASQLIRELEDKGLVVRNATVGSTIVVASQSEVLVQSSIRHLGKSMSVMDAPGFADACSLVDGDDLLFVSNEHAAYLMPAVFTRAYTSYSGFVSRLSSMILMHLNS